MTFCAAEEVNVSLSKLVAYLCLRFAKWTFFKSLTFTSIYIIVETICIRHSINGFLPSPHFFPLDVGSEMGGGGRAVIQGPPAVH